MVFSIFVNLIKLHSHHIERLRAEIIANLSTVIIVNPRVMIIANLRGVDWMTRGISNYGSLKGSVIIPSLNGSSKLLLKD